ncbi:class I SAM-dependent methyltransferase [Nocardia huaxiensis]|uniref:Class I SAM-dependent methyltransferase n=1 Tax=Nocardia huaxiensis TaxID=2755382 RepID=A0A7D6ZRG9_9NOCA|nr:class I SAM-dependent methyltransferase [Nocardia huaxiensis]QLY33583.1 class I SAM-dependent methyltransferase [Nocardia huaxiensis]
MEVPDAERWNHNIHYHGLLAEAVADAGQVLDIGCGEGMLARRLRAQGSEVTGIDLHEPSLERARAQSPDGGITYLNADFLTYPFPPESFDGIVSVAALHHMDTTAALTHMRDLLRPGGTLAVVGLTRDAFPRDLPYVAAAWAATIWQRLVHSQWEHASPVAWPPPETFPEFRDLATNLLPGSRVRRHVLWRYSLLWTKPVHA